MDAAAASDEMSSSKISELATPTARRRPSDDGASARMHGARPDVYDRGAEYSSSRPCA